MLSLFVDDYSSLLEDCVDEYEDSMDELESDLAEIEAENFDIDDFIDDSLEDDIITQEDIDMANSELLDDYETELASREDGTSYANDDSTIANPFTEKITIEDYLNDF